MWPAPPALLAALDGSHEATVRVTVLRAGTVLGSIPIAGGSVSATLATTASRDASLSVERRVLDEGFLDPLSDEVVIYSVVAGYDIPLFTGRVDVVSDNSDGSVSVTCIDRSTEVVRARFESPWASRPVNNVHTEMRRMVQDVNALWGFETFGLPEERVPVAVWEEDRGQALNELAATAGAYWVSDRVGGIAVHRNPFRSQQPLDPVVTLRDGEDGVLVSISRVLSREDVHNSVTVVSERTDSSPPVRVTVRDTLPGSPTRWGGPFGKQNRVVKLSTVESLGLAKAVALRLLNQSLALTQSLQLSLAHFPLLDPGDVVGVWWRGVPTLQVVESVTYPLGAPGASALSTRELRLLPPDDITALSFP